MKTYSLGAIAQHMLTAPGVAATLLITTVNGGGGQRYQNELGGILSDEAVAALANDDAVMVTFETEEAAHLQVATVLDGVSESSLLVVSLELRLARYPKFFTGYCTNGADSTQYSGTAVG